MTETNIRVVAPGATLYLDTRCIEVVALDCSPELVQRACNALRRRGLAAVPGPGGGLLVVAREPIPSLIAQEDNWCVEVKDRGQTRRLKFAEPDDIPLLAQLVERCLLIEIGRRTHFWTLDSPRIWYEPTPFKTAGDIAAYRRLEVSAIPIASVGIGLVVDVSTAFFTRSSVADFLRNDAPEHERQHLQARFAVLSERQRGQKGTLLYDVGRSKHKCYFEELLSGVTCATTPPLRLNGRTYTSLFEYYQEKYPDLPIKADDPVAKVSFPGLDNPQPVAANRLSLRVMNEALPEDLKQVDKIAPADRRGLIEEFWTQLGEAPLGRGKPHIHAHFWRPENGRVVHLTPPNLLFAGERVVSAPSHGALREYQDYHRQRRTLLREVGCVSVPPAVTRMIHFAVPDTGAETMVTRLSEDMIGHLSSWTRKPMTSQVVPYRHVEDAFSLLHQEKQPGVVVFVFDDDDPAMYFTVSYALKPWRVKRITCRTLQEKFSKLRLAEYGDCSGNGKLLRKAREWESFTEMSALDVLQQLDCVPWTIAGGLHYEAQLAIDVGEDRRHFALSLFICRAKPAHPTFWLDTVVEIKADPKRETINEIHLCDKIVALFQRVQRRRLDPLRSILVLRDGRECGRELDGVASARERLVQVGCMDKRARVDVVDFHKRSVKGVRLWDWSREGEVRHALEGTALFVDARTVVLVNTGAATLHQGTAEPLMLTAQGEGIDMAVVAADVHATTHLNYSSPGVAQKLPLALKRTDDELTSRAAQEIRRLR